MTNCKPSPPFKLENVSLLGTPANREVIKLNHSA